MKVNVRVLDRRRARRGPDRDGGGGEGGRRR